MVETSTNAPNDHRRIPTPTARVPDALPTTAPERSSQTGATRVELIVALIVVVTSLAVILSVCLHHGKLRRTDAELNLAFCAARDNLEEIRSLPIDDIPGLDGAGFDIPALNGTPGGLRSIPGDPDRLAGEFAVVDLHPGATGNRRVYRVTATVVWTGTFPRQTFSLETSVISRR